MKKVRAAIVGYGNIGHYVLEALQAAPDFEIAGVVRRAGAENKPEELANYAVVKDIKELGEVDVAILCTPTRSVEKYAKEYLAMGINTVDSFDIHTGIVDLRRTLNATAKEHKAVSIISAGWDPGSDSIVRTMLEAIAPKGITYTNFGPGMSMGHTVAVKAIDGVKAALSMTIPTGTGIHRRMVYIELKDGYKFEEVAAAILLLSVYSCLLYSSLFYYIFVLHNAYDQQGILFFLHIDNHFHCSLTVIVNVLVCFQIIFKCKCLRDQRS